MLCNIRTHGNQTFPHRHPNANGCFPGNDIIAPAYPYSVSFLS
jgi:hypothetical protein